MVTGAGGGLGREYALLLAERGARVLVNDLGLTTSRAEEGASSRPAEAVVAEIGAAGGIALASGSSVATSTGGREIVEAALDAWGRVDIVINNAGVSGRDAPIAGITDDDLQLVMDVQVGGHFNVIRPAWRAMSAQGYGRILNISSSSVFGFARGEPCSYPSAKAAIIGMTRDLALQGGPEGIMVNALMPMGYTRMAADVLNDEMRAWMSASFPAAKVAPVAAFLVHEDVPCTGEIFSAGGGRFARVYLAESMGVTSKDMSLETVRESFAEAMTTDNAVLISSAADEFALWVEHLGLQQPPA